MALEVESLTGGEPREVKIGDLEKEISELWRSATKDEKNPEAVMRAAALTLVVYVESPEDADEVHNLAGAVSEQNPCRVITLISQPHEQPAGLRSWISAHCKCDAAGSGRKQIRLEEIVIRASGGAVRDLGNLALQLTLSGLPVYFWWRAGRFQPPEHFEQILRVASHILVDSARFDDAEADLAALARLAKKWSKHHAFADLNWARLTPWRELIAQCFDNPGTRGYAEKIRRLNIEYEAESPRHSAQAAQALLISGWLASRLNWAPARPSEKNSAASRSKRFRSPTGEVEIDRVARSFEGGGGGVCFSVSLEAEGDPPASFRLERGCDGRNVATHAEIKGRPPVSRTARLEVLDEAELLNGELQFPGRDRIFEEALERVADSGESGSKP